MIYCVEDDKSIRDLIVYALGSGGFEAHGMCDGKELSLAVSKEVPDLILLDIMLPGEDGISILKRLRASGKTKAVPIIMLTAKSAEYDKVLGLDLGADDYITKPFGVMELISRVKAVLRRTGAKERNPHLSVGDVTIDVDKHQVLAKGKEVTLTLKEFELLRYLMENTGLVLTRDKVLETVWGYEYEGETRTVDVHIRTLRQKLGDCGGMIETVRGVGYRIGGRE